MQADFEGENYSVSHKGERFALGAMGTATRNETITKDTEEAIRASALA